MNLKFHHIGVPVDKSKLSNKARYSSIFKMYSEDAKNNIGLRIQYHAFDEGNLLDEKIKNQIHIAFKTNDIESVLEGKQIIMPLYEPFKNYKCAMILINGLLVELIETSLSENELWEDEKTLKNGVLYGE